MQKIYCKSSRHDWQAYYLTDGKRDYYLCEMPYDRSSWSFFSQGRRIEEVLSARRHSKERIRRASERLVSVVKYAEKEYGICVFRQTAKKLQKRRTPIKRQRTELELDDAV